MIDRGQVKQCPACKLEKALSEYHKHANMPDGVATYCKPCVSSIQKKCYVKYIHRKRKQYRDNREKILAQHKLYRQTPAGIYNGMKINGAVTMTRYEFTTWYERQDKLCVYCGITAHEYAKLNNPIFKGTRRLSIDRMNSQGIYSLDNIVLACATCNNIKSDFLTFQDMKEIGEIYVKPKRKRPEKGAYV